MIELGAGYSGLASLVLAAYLIRENSPPVKVAITDGLDICAESNNFSLSFFLRV